MAISSEPTSRSLQKRKPPATTEPNKHTPALPVLLLTKVELAPQLRVSVRTIDNMMAQRLIPFIRVTKRSVRFHLARVLAALEKREVHEVNR